jgi:hypothetical protein
MLDLVGCIEHNVSLKDRHREVRSRDVSGVQLGYVFVQHCKVSRFADFYRAGDPVES